MRTSHILAALAFVAAAASAQAQSGGANLGSAQLMAAVQANGTLFAAKSKGTIACTGTGGNCRTATGTYALRFARDISGCTFATAPAPTDVVNGSYDAVRVAVSVATPANMVHVNTTHAATGAAVNAGFFVQVLC